MLASTVFSWGFIIVKAVALPAPTMAFWRLVIGVSSLLVAMRLLRIPAPRNLRPIVLAGICFGAHQLLYMLAVQRTSIAVVTLVTALQPLIVTAISRRVVGERVPPALALWSLAALAGVGVVVQANWNLAGRTLLGDVLALLNLLCYVGFFLLSKRARGEGAHPVSLTAVAMASSLVVVFPALLFAPRVAPAEWWQWGLLALLALIPGNGHVLVNWAHARISAALASIALSAVPLLASIWAHLVFGEPYGARHVAGMLLVIAAVEGGRRADAAVERARAASG